MEQRRDLAIILRSVAYEERHRIVTALTENHGQVSAMARNSIQSRRFGGTLEPFAAAEWTYVDKPGAELWRLDEAKIRRSYEGLRKNFERLSLASVFNELMLKLAPKQQPCPELFRLHSNALAALEEAPDETDPEKPAELAFLNGYLAKLLQWSGSQPRLLHCLGCETPLDRVDSEASLTCRISDAGWLCGNCRSAEAPLLKVQPMAVLDFHVCLLLPIRQVSGAMQATRAQHQELFKFLEALFAYHLPGFDREPLKSLRFISGLESNLRPAAENPRQRPPLPV